MSHLILVRHGQSEWNLQKRFTGLVDIDLTANGKLEACKSGELLKDKSIKIDISFSSVQKRSINTLKLIMNTMRIKSTFTKAWQLNERHYGALTGLNKEEMKKKLGEKKIHEFRRSWDIKPEPLNKNNPFHPINIEVYKDIPKEDLPDTESLEDTFNRVLPYYKSHIQTKLVEGKNVLVVAHGNSIRAICKYLFKLDEKKISSLEIPTGNPLLIRLGSSGELIDCEYLDKSRSNDLIVF